MTLLLVLCAVPLAAAQDDYHKFEVYGGFSRQNPYGLEGDIFIQPSDDQKSGNGFNASATYNFSKYVGVKFDVANHRGSGLFATGIFCTTTGPVVCGGASQETKATSLSLQGGVQIKNNSKTARFKPFGQVLAGTTRLSTTGGAVFGLDKISTSGFSASVGGGLDIRVSKRIDIRVIQFNYTPVFAKSKTYTYDGPPLNYSGGTFATGSTFGVDSKRYNLYNFGFGVAFH
jgi:hypothetical protein